MHISNHRTTKMKKLCAILLLIAMTTALAVPAFAADITIESSTSISTYAAERSYNGYKLLNLTTSEENTVPYCQTRYFQPQIMHFGHLINQRTQQPLPMHRFFHISLL